MCRSTVNPRVVFSIGRSRALSTVQSLGRRNISAMEIIEKPEGAEIGRPFLVMQVMLSDESSENVIA